MQTYNESRSAGAAPKRVKLEQIIEAGRMSAVRAIERAQATVPTDRVVRATALRFEGTKTHVVVGYADAPGHKVHNNAFGQLTERAGIPGDFARELSAKGEWGNQLLAHNFQTVYGHQPETRYLTRTVGDEMRGFLSNKFRRIDSRPIIDALAIEAQAVGAVPVEGIHTDTRVALRLILPRVFEPVPGEFVAYGLDWQNSDYGNGAHTLREYVLRIWCENGATVADTLREVHLGRRLDEGEEWSDRTHKLDTQRSISMVRDSVRGQLTASKIEERMLQIKAAAEAKLDPKEWGVKLKKMLGAGVAKQAIEAFSSADVEMLPPGQNTWRMSNALSWLAGKETDGDKRIELNRAAGEILALGAKQAA